MDGHGIITPREPLPLGKIYASLQMVQKHLIQLILDHVPVTDTIPPTVPTVDTDLTGKSDYFNSYNCHYRSKYTSGFN